MPAALRPAKGDVMPESMTKDLLPPPELHELRNSGTVALFLDFDGTLVDLAATPDAIHVPDGLAHALEALGTRHRGAMAVVSGRALDNLAEHLGAFQFAVAGSHGAEVRGASGETIGAKPTMLLAAVQDAVDLFARDNAEVSIERKAYGLALHYRAAPHLEDSVRGFAAELAAAYDLQIKQGKAVCELMQSRGGKDRAVSLLMQRPLFAGAHPVFIGDDVTDEDGFEEVVRRGGTAIVVGERDSAAAQFRLADPAAVRDWLSL